MERLASDSPLYDAISSLQTLVDSNKPNDLSHVQQQWTEALSAYPKGTGKETGLDAFFLYSLRRRMFLLATIVLAKLNHGLDSDAMNDRDSKLENDCRDIFTSYCDMFVYIVIC